MLVVQTLPVLGVQPFGTCHQPVPGQLGVQTEIELPNCGLAETFFDEIDVGRWRGAGDHRLVVGIGIEHPASRRASAEAATAADDAGRHAGVGVRVGQPDRCRCALEQADTTAQLHPTLVLRVEVEVEAQTRLHQLSAIERHGVVQSETTGLARVGRGVASDCWRGSSGVGERLVGRGLGVDAQARHQGQLLVELPGVLQEDADAAQAPGGCAVGKCLARCGHLGLVGESPALLEVLEDGLLDLGRRGAAAVDRTEAVGVGGAAVDAAEAVVAKGVLQEGVEDFVAAEVDACLDLVRAQRPVAREVAVSGLGCQRVVVAAAFGAEVQRAVGDRGGRHACRQGAGQEELDLRQLGVVRRHAGVVSVRELGFGAEAGAPISEPLSDHGLDRFVLRVPV